MKRCIIMVLLVTFSIYTAFAIDLSTGGGIDYTIVTEMTNITYNSPLASSYSYSTAKVNHFGITGMFDAKWIQVNLGFDGTAGGQITGSTYSEVKDEDGHSHYQGIRSQINIDMDTKYSWFTLGALLKLPLKHRSGFAIFPLLGAESKLNLAVTDKNGNDLKKDMDSDTKDSLNQLWIKGGLGVDWPLSPKFYLRSNLLVGLKLKSQFEQDMIDDADKYTDISLGSYKTDLSIMVGYRL